MHRRVNVSIRRTSGLLVALAGLLLVARIMPGWFWLLILGVLFIWAGWYLYSED